MEGRAFPSSRRLKKNNLVDGNFNLLNTKTIGLSNFVDPTFVAPIFSRLKRPSHDPPPARFRAMSPKPISLFLKQTNFGNSRRRARREE
jgi:hypothetical protein